MNGWRSAAEALGRSMGDVDISARTSSSSFGSEPGGSSRRYNWGAGFPRAAERMPTSSPVVLLAGVTVVPLPMIELFSLPARVL